MRPLGVEGNCRRGSFAPSSYDLWLGASVHSPGNTKFQPGPELVSIKTEDAAKKDTGDLTSYLLWFMPRRRKTSGSGTPSDAIIARQRFVEVVSGNSRVLEKGKDPCSAVDKASPNEIKEENSKCSGDGLERHYNFVTLLIVARSEDSTVSAGLVLRWSATEKFVCS